MGTRLLEWLLQPGWRLNTMMQVASVALWALFLVTGRA